MEWFVQNYVANCEGAKKVLDVGSYSVNGSYRELFNSSNIEYVGLDIVEGPNVDIVVEDNYCWDSLEDESFDYIISGQAFEHIEFPWLTIKEIYKKLKTGGIVCIAAPNGGPEHKHPYDCYRYFADGLRALAKWAGLMVIDVSVAGIPNRNVPIEWDSVFDDVYMIAIKCQENQSLKDFPRLLYERRYNEAESWRLRYEFLAKWISTEKKDEYIRSFVAKEGCEKVYVYGYGYIGKPLVSELKKIEGLSLTLVDRYKEGVLDGIPCISLENNLDVDDLTTWRSAFLQPKKDVQIENSDQKALMIITVLDKDRDLRLWLDTIFESMPKYYIDEII